MKRFAELFAELDGLRATKDRIRALSHYFEESSGNELAWAVFFLSGRKLKGLIKLQILKKVCIAESGIPEWLFAKTYEIVGDLAETLSLLLPVKTKGKIVEGLDETVERCLLPLLNCTPSRQAELILEAWSGQTDVERLVFNKLITGGFRVGVGDALIHQALGQLTGLDAKVIARRLMGNWLPSVEFTDKLLSVETKFDLEACPYPFFLASPLPEDPNLGDIEEWLCEWKWDGVRAQLIKRGAEIQIWSRGDELLTERFPEVVEEASRIRGDAVLDGELLGFRDGDPLPFWKLQRRIALKFPSMNIRRSIPVVFMAFDLLEFKGQDIRTIALSKRRQLLDELLTLMDEPPKGDFLGQLKLFSPCLLQPSPTLRLSAAIGATSFAQLSEERKKSRALGVEGLILKRLDSTYGAGRQVGSWWKWKLEPMTVDAVLVAAARGHGRRAGLYSDYTFALWQNAELVPFAKAYSGLTDAEIKEVDAFIKANTKAKFGPVATVAPELVFELGFENVNLSKRHKSGLSVRFPRILRWRKDKSAADADTIASITVQGKELHSP